MISASLHFDSVSKQSTESPIFNVRPYPFTNDGSPSRDTGSPSAERAASTRDDAENAAAAGADEEGTVNMFIAGGNETFCAVNEKKGPADANDAEAADSECSTALID